MEELTACEGTVHSVIFQNAENGYTVLTVRAGRENVTVVGVMPEVAAGEQAVFQGEWVQHPQYGRQFKAASCFDSVDTQIAGLGEIADVQQIYIDHTKAAIDSLNG